MIRVLIADDEKLMRTGIRMILDNADDVEVVAEVADGRAAVQACRTREVDVALLDVQMPGGNGITATAEIARASPRTHTVVLTAFNQDQNIAKALQSGATGFLLKDTGPAELIHAVRNAASGDPVLAPQITRRLIEQHLTSGADAAERTRQRVDELTSAETDVLRLVGEGLSNAEVAQRLYMATGTVKAHLSRILHKLDCANRVQAAIVAHEAGLLDEA